MKRKKILNQKLIIIKKRKKRRKIKERKNKEKIYMYKKIKPPIKSVGRIRS
jgi:hypothetical protein